MDVNERTLVVGDEYVFSGIYAKTRKQRRKGLSGIDISQAPNEMIFENCRSVQTFKMKFDLKLVFLDKDNKVIGSRDVKPRRVVKAPKNTFTIVEIPLNNKG
jgi:uncharacterized membrane protein (UPF0127 family)